MLGAPLAILFGDEWPQVKVKNLATREESADCRTTALACALSVPQLKFLQTCFQLPPDSTCIATHDCNSLRKTDIGKQVTLAGWVHVSRDHGGVIFIDLRDREGLTQVVFRPEENAELAKQAHTLRSEDVIQVSGQVAPRVPGTENPKLATGDIEVIPSALHILNRADDAPLPDRCRAAATKICA